MEENKTVVEVAPEVTPAVEETKKSVLNASVAPEEFDWDAFENDDVYGGSVEAIAEQYNQTLSKVVEGEVVEGYRFHGSAYRARLAVRRNYPEISRKRVP